MKLTMRRMRLFRLVMATNTKHAPTFRLRGEMFRLARHNLAASIINVDTDRRFVELELARTHVLAHADALIVLRPSDIEGGEPLPYEKGKPVVSV